MSQIKVDANNLSSLRSQLTSAQTQMEDIGRRVLSISQSLDWQVKAREQVDESLSLIKKNVSSHGELLNRYAAAIDTTCSKFTEADSSTASKVGNVSGIMSALSWAAGAGLSAAALGIIFGSKDLFNQFAKFSMDAFPLNVEAILREQTITDNNGMAPITRWYKTSNKDIIKSGKAVLKKGGKVKKKSGFWSNVKKTVGSAVGSAKRVVASSVKSVKKAAKSAFGAAKKIASSAVKSYKKKGVIYKAVQYGKAAVKIVKGGVKIAGAVAAIAAAPVTGGASIPLAALSIVSAGNDMISGFADMTYTHYGAYDQIGQYNWLKETLTENAGQLGEYFGNREIGEKIGQYVYTGIDVVTFFDGADKVIKNLRKLDTLTTHTVRNTFAMGQASLKEIGDYISEPGKIGELIKETGKGVYKSLTGAWKLGEKISKLI